jgi:hypothetical protein
MRAIVFLIATCLGALLWAGPGNPSALGAAPFKFRPTPALRLIQPSSAPPSYKRVFSTWKDNPHASHTFFAPSAIPLRQGQGYYQNSYVLMHSAWFAPLNEVSIGGGFQVMSVLASLRPGQKKLPGYFLAMKIGKRLQPGIHAGIYAVGTQLSNDPPFQDSLDTGRKMGAVIGQCTIGTMEAHATLNFGYGVTGIGLTRKPLFGFSAQWRFTEPLAIITENWVLNFGVDAFPVYTLGVRFIHRKLGADAALVYNKDLSEGVGPVLPYFGFSLLF